ncbi:MAG: MOSC domain-containing protein [bacterium]
MNLRIQSLHIYPLKSAGGVQLESAECHSQGIQWDRRWMLVDRKGLFISARKYPKMLNWKLSGHNGVFDVHITGKDAYRLPIPTAYQRLCVRVWKSTFSAAWCGTEADQFFSDSLNIQCRLVYLDDFSFRPIDRKYARIGETVSFADGFPLLLCSQTSLDALNAQLDQPVPMSRFRPNIVVSGAQKAWAEDHWRKINLAQGSLEVRKPCSRCIMITVDETGQKNPEQQPLKLLKQIHANSQGEAIFGQNVVASAPLELTSNSRLSADV